PEPLRLHLQQLVPMAAQLGRAARPGVARAGDRRLDPEIGQGSEVGIANSVGVQLQIDEHRIDANMWHALGRSRSAAYQTGTTAQGERLVEGWTQDRRGGARRGQGNADEVG